jgi:hypothetical protein
MTSAWVVRPTAGLGAHEVSELVRTQGPARHDPKRFPLAWACDGQASMSSVKKIRRHL